jgi:hypothetical protein
VSMSIACRTELPLPAMRQITVRRPGMFAAEKVDGLRVVVRFLTSAPVEGAACAPAEQSENPACHRPTCLVDCDTRSASWLRLSGDGAEVAGRGFASWVGEAAYLHGGVAYTSAA